MASVVRQEDPISAEWTDGSDGSCQLCASHFLDSLALQEVVREPTLLLNLASTRVRVCHPCVLRLRLLLSDKLADTLGPSAPQRALEKSCEALNDEAIARARKQASTELDLEKAIASRRAEIGGPKLRTYTWIELRLDDVDAVMIVAATSKRAAARARGLRLAAMHNFCETWQPRDIAQSLVDPGVVFYRQHRSRSPFKWYQLTSRKAKT